MEWQLPGQLCIRGGIEVSACVFFSSFETKPYYVAHTGLDLAMKPTYVHFEGLRLLGVTLNSTCFLSYVGPTY